GWPRRRDLVLIAIVVAALAAIAVALAYDRRIAPIFVGAAAATFILLRLVAAGVMALARALPRPRHPVLRLALGNILRPGALTPAVVLSLGLGLATLVTVTQIDGNLHRQFTAALPERAPSFYFIDIPSREADAFRAFLARERPDATI